MTTDDVTARYVLIYANVGVRRTGNGQVFPALQYIHNDNGDYVLKDSRRGAAMFRPVEAQKFIRAASACPYKLAVEAVK